MDTYNTEANREKELFRGLVQAGVLAEKDFETACEAAACRNMAVARILRFEYNVPRRKLLEILAAHHGCQWIEYDERLPVPPQLLTGLDGRRLYANQWVPVIQDGDTVIIAAVHPQDPAVIDDVKTSFPAAAHELRVALAEDVVAFIDDFLNSAPDHLIGNERTGLAYWRNTMARWRTRLACYRTDFAVAKTRLSLLRGGLTLIAIGNVLLDLSLRKPTRMVPVFWLMIATGFSVVIYGVIGYFRIKHPIFSPPKHQTLVEVTAASLYFFEDFQFVDNKPKEFYPKHTMLARITDNFPNYCVFIDSSHDNKIRSHLAHERTSLAAQRTVLSCYRTIYARARIGLAFIRTGVSFLSIGFGLIQYFGVNVLTIFDCFLIVAGLSMAIDGMVWYWPVRKEKHEASKCEIMD
jgi:uncharacterized membrane protein YidH (DUF202 family)